MKALSVVVMAASLGIASAATAQTGTGTYQPQQQAQMPTNADGSFTDECGIRYNSRGDRIDARGRILPPPVSSPSGKSCRPSGR